jgi:hypothetical protein
LKGWQEGVSGDEEISSWLGLARHGEAKRKSDLMSSRDILEEVLGKTARGQKALALIDELAADWEQGWRLERKCVSGWCHVYDGTRREANAAYLAVTRQLELVSPHVRFRVLRPDGSVDINN